MTHRFYIEGQPAAVMHFGEQRAWVQSPQLLQQWLRVLRLRVGEEVSLFDDHLEVMYKISDINDREVALEKVTELERRVPRKPVMLAWSLLKRDKNDWVIQKATEIGVTHFVPVIAEHSEKTGLDLDRSRRIIVEASEQCGRADIPRIEEPQPLAAVIQEYRQHYELVVAHMSGGHSGQPGERPYGVLIGPEGGWSKSELDKFNQLQLPTMAIGQFVLRAETAAIVAAAKLVTAEVA